MTTSRKPALAAALALGLLASCKTGSGGKTEEPLICEPHAYEACNGNDVYWFDSCDVPQEIEEDCPDDNATCALDFYGVPTCQCIWNWEGEECAECPPNWDPDADCQACLPNWDQAADCLECLGNWDPDQDCLVCLYQWIDEGNDCGTCPEHWDAAQDCAVCEGNWDPEQDCSACLNQWIDEGNDCGTCPDNWDPAQDCAECLGNWDPEQACLACLNQWIDEGDDCGTCPGNWDPETGCAECLPGWSGDDCDVECIRFVDHDAPASGDGLGWDTAARVLQDGIDLADDASVDFNGGCDVWVAEGTYYIYRGDIDNRVHVPSDVQLYGGFDGTETSFDERDPVVNETVLDGRQYAGGSYRVRHVVVLQNGAGIDGFVVTGGRADGLDGEGETGNSRGGGVLVADSDGIRIANCRFFDNEAYGVGGGVYFAESSGTIENCEFTGNWSLDGGGALSAFSSEVVISRSSFAGNSTDGDGGAIMSWYGYDEAGSIASCTFSGNTAEGAGGAISLVFAYPELRNCTIYENEAGEPGGGLWVGVELSPTSMYVENAIIWGNTPDEMATDDMEKCFVTYSDVPGEFAGEGNFYNDPLFVDPDGGDLHLSVGSPAIDAANGLVAPELDLDGNARVDDPATDNTGLGPPWADMGAYEFQP